MRNHSIDLSKVVRIYVRYEYVQDLISIVFANSGYYPFAVDRTFQVRQFYVV